MRSNLLPTFLVAAASTIAACSVINAPDDVKPGGTGTGGEGASGSQQSSGTGPAQPCTTAADCTVDACKVATCEMGECHIEPVGNNTPCDDGKACTENDFCASGVCTSGAAKQCTPANDCNTSVCDEAAGGACVETAVADDTPCNDGDPCTATSTCIGGACVPGPTCKDTECTTGTCTAQGCMDVPKSMGTPCGVTGCSIGQCDNQGQCVIVPINQGQPCDDGKFCTTGEHCNNQGQCLGTQTCGPDQACFMSGCDEALQSCTMTPIMNDLPCDDGDACSVGTTCQSGVCGAPMSTISQCINGDGCCPAGCTLGNDSDCFYWKNGVQKDVPEAALLGWSLCYSDHYDNFSTPVATILSACSKSKLLLGCRPVGQPIFNLVAMAPRVDVLFPCGNLTNCTKQSNGVGWYFDDNFSWGFAPGGQPVNRNSCDYDDGTQTSPELRVCWHTSGMNISTGYRCGTDYPFSDWERVVYQAN